jgi:hypothetical protein
VENEIVRLGNEVVVFGFFFGNVQRQPYDRKCTSICPRRTI